MEEDRDKGSGIVVEDRANYQTHLHHNYPHSQAPAEIEREDLVHIVCACARLY